MIYCAVFIVERGRGRRSPLLSDLNWNGGPFRLSGYSVGPPAGGSLEASAAAISWSTLKEMPSDMERPAL